MQHTFTTMDVTVYARAGTVARFASIAVCEFATFEGADADLQARLYV